MAEFSWFSQGRCGSHLWICKHRFWLIAYLGNMFIWYSTAMKKVNNFCTFLSCSCPYHNVKWHILQCCGQHEYLTSFHFLFLSPHCSYHLNPRIVFKHFENQLLGIIKEWFQKHYVRFSCDILAVVEVLMLTSPF